MTITPTGAARYTFPHIPLELSWTGPGGSRPVPLRVIRGPRGARAGLPKMLTTNCRHLPSPPAGPLNFSALMRGLCADIVARCPVFHHVDVQRLFVGVTQARRHRRHGLQAKVTPMRFQHGQLVRRRRGRLYQVQRYWVDGVEVLYLMAFCLPRFLDQSFEEKLVTVFHELYHIAPEFDGDLRRHDGRYCLHTRSQKGYDRHMASLAREYLASGADPGLHAFLRPSFVELEQHYGRIVGHAIPVPKLVPVGE
jgi:predicted metallopeptidase